MSTGVFQMVMAQATHMYFDRLRVSGGVFQVVMAQVTHMYPEHLQGVL